MKRGEIWWANLHGPAGRRPILLVSRDEAYAVRGRILAAPIYTRTRQIRAELPLGPAEGLDAECAANCDSLICVSKRRIEKYVASLAADKVRLLDEALRFALGLTP